MPVIHTSPHSEKIPSVENEGYSVIIMRDVPKLQSHAAPVTEPTPITQVWGSPHSLQLPRNDVQGPHPPPKDSDQGGGRKEEEKYPSF